MNCSFCNNVFTTKTSLNTHQKTAKYCLVLRQVEQNEYKCESCGREFSTKTNLNRHQKSCKTGNILSDKLDIIDNLQEELHECKIKLTEKDKQLEEQKNTIHDLQKQMQEVAMKAVSRSTTTNNKTQINNYIQNMQPVTEQHLIDNVQHLTIDHIMKGPEGYAEYAMEYPLKDRLLCVDYARRKVKFKDRDGNVITDPEMSNLATKFFNSIKDKNKELILECGKKLKENFGDELDTIVRIFDYKSSVDKSSGGEKTDFHHDFVKQVCSKSICE
jgi:hypothetical protein